MEEMGIKNEKKSEKRGKGEKEKEITVWLFGVQI